MSQRYAAIFVFLLSLRAMPRHAICFADAAATLDTLPRHAMIRFSRHAADKRLTALLDTFDTLMPLPGCIVDMLAIDIILRHILPYARYTRRHDADV